MEVEGAAVREGVSAGVEDLDGWRDAARDQSVTVVHSESVVEGEVFLLIDKAGLGQAEATGGRTGLSA